MTFQEIATIVKAVEASPELIPQVEKLFQDFMALKATVEKILPASAPAPVVITPPVAS